MRAEPDRGTDDSTGAPRDDGWAVPAALALVDTQYGISARSVVRLGGEVDLNLAVVGTDGRRVVVKVGPADTDLARLRWQHEVLHGLSGTDGGPQVPQVIAAHDGSRLTWLETAGQRRAVRVQTWVPGRIVAELDRHSSELLQGWGRAAGWLTVALAACVPPDGVAQTHHWDALRAPEAIAAVGAATVQAAHETAVRTLLEEFERRVPPLVQDLPRQVVHQDLNDFNVLATADAIGRQHVTGVLDFGDVLHTARVSELAIAVAYAMLRKPDPLLAAADVVRGYCELAPLTDEELAAVFPIAAARLCVNALTWTARAGSNGDYARLRMRHTWPTIHRLAAIPPSLARAALQAAVGRANRAATPAARAAPHPQVTARAFTPVAEPAQRSSDAGAPATIRLAAGLRTNDAVPMPVDGRVVHADGDRLVVHHATDPEYWSRWIGVTELPEPGAHIAAGDLLRTPSGSVSLAVFAAADAAAAAPDVVAWTSLPAWRLLCADPGALWGTSFAESPPADTVAARKRHFAGSQRHYFDRPPRLVRSSDVWLYDEHGMAYLDSINNVAHVGHANPVVVEAMHRQAALLNTNSRFVFDGIADYAGRLASLLPPPLDVVFLVCTGSEANDLALRIARQVTGREDVLVIDGAYHGNTAADTAISPNRYKGPGGAGRPATTHELPQPNLYRGRYRSDDPQAAEHYASDAAVRIDELAADGRSPAALIAESVLGTAGTIVPTPGYLPSAFAAVRAHGGLCISDEVQVGFGRLGSHFWGFQLQGVVPDIVTMGKPIGNGHPLAAVVTTREIADAFDTGMKYFNTFGGNPVSCAVGMAVLDEIERHDLQSRARDVGAYLLDRLGALARRHEIIGDVRGVGLYLGIELVVDRSTREPAAVAARYLSERLKDEGVFTYPTGADDNILKIKPPMTFTREHADLFVDVLDDVLSSDW